MTRMIQDILKLSVPERILIVEAIWDSITENDEKLELTEDTKQVLEERLESYRKNPDNGSNWTEVKARIKRQL